jgi:hypothetical protein
MSTQSWKNESAAIDVMSFGSSGSVDFGGSTPSSSSCKCTMDGLDVNSGGNWAPGTVPPAANDRATGSVSLAGDTSTSITTGKSTYAIVNNDNQWNGNLPAINIRMKSQSTTAFVLYNYGTDTGTANYSYL